MSVQWLNTFGLITNAAGVLLLFRYAMPYRLAVDGGEVITTSIIRSKERKKDGFYRKLALFGLLLILIGTALQIGATWNA